MSHTNLKNSSLPSINLKQITLSSLLLLLLVTTSTQQQQSQSSTYECPRSCECNEIDLSARCENLEALVRSYRTKHNSNLMPIKSLDLSNNRLTKISHQLELLVNLTALNLSHNHLTQVQKLHFEHLETLDLSHNRITSGKLSKLPRNVVHLNLTHNDITYLPVDFMKLKKLRTLELDENPLNCTCDTLMVRNWIGLQSVWSSHAIVCHAPQMFKGQPWLQARQNEACIEQPSTTTASNDKWENFDMNDVMMGDQPADDPPNEDGDYTTDDDNGKKVDDVVYDDVFDTASEPPNDDEVDANTPEDDEQKNDENELDKDFIKVDDHHHHSHEGSTEEPPTSGEKAPASGEEDENEEGSGSTPPENIIQEEEDGSGASGAGPIIHINEDPSEEIPTNARPDLNVNIFEDNDPSEAPAVQRGGVDSPPPPDAETIPGIESPQATGSEQVKKASSEDNSGTYILLAIIGILLVSLIIFVAMKNRQEKRQNRNRYDVEKNNAQELQDMDKRLLGKPIEKNGNGKHAENSPLINEYSEPKEYRPYNNAPAITVDEPIQELPQKSTQSLYDNNNPNGNAPVEPVHGNGSLSRSPDSEDEVFHPAVEDHASPAELAVTPEVPKRYSPIYSSPTSPKSARYSPVYDEQGRVKIKLTETPKPKTPVIVNRTRSRAGEYINTPN